MRHLTTRPCQIQLQRSWEANRYPMVRNILTVHLSKEAMICKGLQSIQYLQCLAMVLEPVIPSSSTQDTTEAFVSTVDILDTTIDMLNNSEDTAGVYTTHIDTSEESTTQRTTLEIFTTTKEISDTIDSGVNLTETTLMEIMEKYEMTTENYEEIRTTDSFEDHTDDTTDSNYDSYTAIPKAFDDNILGMNNQIKAEETTSILEIDDKFETTANILISSSRSFPPVPETGTKITSTSFILFNSSQDITNFLSQVATTPPTFSLQTKTLVPGIPDWVIILVLIIIILLFLICFCLFLYKHKHGRSLTKLGHSLLLQGHHKHARLMSVSPINLKQVKNTPTCWNCPRNLFQENDFLKLERKMALELPILEEINKEIEKRKANRFKHLALPPILPPISH